MTKATEKEQFGWHWLPADGFIARYEGKIRKVKGTVGLVLDLRSKVDVPDASARRRPIEPCNWGLHFSDTPGQAYQFAPDGPQSILTYVKASGKIVNGRDKYAASRREILAILDTEKLSELNGKVASPGECLFPCSARSARARFSVSELMELSDRDKDMEFERLCLEEAQRQMGMLVSSTSACPHCGGTGNVTSLVPPASPPKRKRAPAKKKAPILNYKGGSRRKPAKKIAKKPVRKRR